MATTFYMSPISLLVQLFNNIGVPLQGGFINTYLGGSVNTAQTTYTDSTGTTANQNPIALSSTGRMVAASGAPVAVWVPAGTITKIVITDSTGAFILSLDNIPALSDPSTILALLASVSTSTVLGGADLVANAMRSYDVFASVRAAAVPVLATGQTLIIDSEGALSPTDGNGGFFYWNAASTSTDDGIIYLKPNAISSANPGRYVRQAQTGVGGIVTAKSASVGTPPNIIYNVVQNIVTLRIPAFSGVSSSNAFTIILPALNAIMPANEITQLVNIPVAQDNGVAIYGQQGIIDFVYGTNAQIILTLWKNGSSTGWTATGTKGLGDIAGLYSTFISYSLS